MITTAALLLASLPQCAPAPPPRPAPVAAARWEEAPTDLVAEAHWPMYSSLYSFHNRAWAEGLYQHYRALSQAHLERSELYLHHRDEHLRLAFEYSQLSNMAAYLEDAWRRHEAGDGHARDYWVRQRLHELKEMIGEDNFRDGNIALPRDVRPK